MIPLRDTVRSRSTPAITLVLIAVNVLAFLQEASLGRHLPQLIHVLGFVPARFVFWQDYGHAPLEVWRFVPLVSAAFLHGGWAHLLGNMWFLWIFGGNVEDRLGHGRFLFFYLIAGMAAFAFQALVTPYSEVPTVGASGAIAGVLGAYFLLYPRSKILTLIPIFIFPWFVEIPAVLFIGVWFLMQLLNGVAELGAASGQVAGIAWWAHAGGFVAGMFLCLLLRKPARGLAAYRPRRYRLEEY
jgi:membrane associated rhomboid family serine protease